MDGLEMKVPVPVSSQEPICILVLGPTGAGKSSFIAKVSGKDVPISHGLASCTVNCQKYDFEENGTYFTLIDTPGFDDTTRDDMDILETITSYVTDMRLPQLSAIVYLHRITDQRMTGKNRLNLEILKAFCGKGYYRHVVLLTTMWSEKTLAESKIRENQLLGDSNYWNDMVSNGAFYSPFGDRASASRILEHIVKASLSSVPPTMMETEMKEGKTLEETQAAKVILAERKIREQKCLQELQEEREEELERLREQKLQLIRCVNENASTRESKNMYGKFKRTLKTDHRQSPHSAAHADETNDETDGWIDLSVSGLVAKPFKWAAKFCSISD